MQVCLSLCAPIALRLGASPLGHADQLRFHIGKGFLGCGGGRNASCRSRASRTILAYFPNAFWRRNLCSHRSKNSRKAYASST